jgi:hypothetical protein
MTPKEKAKALVEKFLKMEYGVLEEYFPSTHTYLAKQCAIICVNEMIEVVRSAWDKLGCGEIGELKDYIPYIYWQSVLTEITNL